MNWLTASIISLILFGLWAFFPKISSEYINAKQAMPYEVLGAVLVGVLFFIFQGIDFNHHPKGYLFAFLTGVCGTLGTFFYFYAASQGKLSIIVTLTALYPIITIALSIFLLEEKISPKQYIGIVLAVLAIYFLSSE